MPIDYNPVTDVKEKLRHIVEQANASHPGVSFDEMISEGDAAPCLLERSKGADLLVVGTRGHGGFTGLLVGSVSMHCATHAHCPVVVLRAEH
jgi:nucleotide-binding universal stress UspA family protein